MPAVLHRRAVCERHGIARRLLAAGLLVGRGWAIHGAALLLIGRAEALLLQRSLPPCRCPCHVHQGLCRQLMPPAVTTARPVCCRRGGCHCGCNCAADGTAPLVLALADLVPWTGLLQLDPKSLRFMRDHLPRPPPWPPPQRSAVGRAPPQVPPWTSTRCRPAAQVAWRAAS